MIATVDSSGKITALKTGIAIITASTSDGSNLTSKFYVNVGNVVLTIHFTNETVKTYILSEENLTSFTDWYRAVPSSSASIPPYWRFEKTPTSSDFTKRYEYVLYNTIFSFDIDMQ